MKSIWYYIVYRKFRILVSNVWFRDFNVNDKFKFMHSDWYEYSSESGIYSIRYYRALGYITIYKKPHCKYGDQINFFLDDNIDSQVSKYFLENFKHKLLEKENIVSYKRNKKLNRIKC